MDTTIVLLYAFVHDTSIAWCVLTTEVIDDHESSPNVVSSSLYKFLPWLTKVSGLKTVQDHEFMTILHPQPCKKNRKVRCQGGHHPLRPNKCLLMPKNTLKKLCTAPWRVALLYSVVVKSTCY